MQPHNPTVTFVVPCYRLGHLLSECVQSILSQSYKDFEILVMDDCSPDDTPAVAASFSDPRVVHVRNATNIGNIANYNKGINLARGAYVWLISADDRLRRPYVLERYVTLMESHQQVGYVFCPPMGLANGKETDILLTCYHGPEDWIMDGREFLLSLLKGNSVSAPSGMVRKSCYEKIGVFPDMPFAGDWYLWCVFALQTDVAYFGEPMVNYRVHDLNLTKVLRRKDRRMLSRDEFSVLWRVRADAEHLGNTRIAKACLKAIMAHYAWRLEGSEAPISQAEFEESVKEFAPNPRVLRASVLTTQANNFYRDGDVQAASKRYLEAYRANPLQIDALVRYAAAQLGAPGKWARRRIAAIRDFFRSANPSSSSRL